MATIRNHLPHSARRHERDGTDARAIVITVSAHVALVLALLAGCSSTAAKGVFGGSATIVILGGLEYGLGNVDDDQGQKNTGMYVMLTGAIIMGASSVWILLGDDEKQ